MPQSSRQSGDDERIDDYVCNRLTPEEQLEFEAEFIGNPALVKKIEEAYAFKQCLVEAKAQGAFSQVTGSSWLEKCWHYFAVPQTLIGAVAASLLLTPLFFLFYKSSTVTFERISYIAPIERDRSGSAQLYTGFKAYVTPGQQVQMVFDLPIPSTSGKALDWDIELVDKDGKVVWYADNQPNSAFSMVQMVVGSNVFRNGIYTYRVFSQEKNLVSSGTIRIGE